MNWKSLNSSCFCQMLFTRERIIQRYNIAREYMYIYVKYVKNIIRYCKMILIKFVNVIDSKVHHIFVNEFIKILCYT